MRQDARVKPLPLTSAVLLLAYGVVRRRRHGRVALAAGALVVAGLVAYGTGLIHPPSAEHLLRGVGAKLGSWTYVVVGLLAFLETGAFVGLIAPGETVILFGGVIAGQGKIDVVVLIAVVWGCAIAGDLASYALGRRLGREFIVRHGPRVRITPERLATVEDFFERHGGAAVFLGRFVGLLRSVLPFLAGSSHLPLRRFVIFDALSAGIWGTGLVLLGYAFWNSFDTLSGAVHQGLLALAGVIALGVGIVWGVRVARDPQLRARVREALGRSRGSRGSAKSSDGGGGRARRASRGDGAESGAGGGGEDTK